MMFRSVGAMAFSLIEVVMALAIASVSLLIVIALLPIGVETDRISANETRAIYILSTVESDLRNSYSTSGRSLIYGLPTPYMANAAGTLTTNTTTLPAINGIVADTSSIGLDNSESKVSLSGVRKPFQATVIYTREWTSGSMSPVEARLIVNWPSLDTTDPTQLTSLGHVSGFVEAYATFSVP